MSAYLALAAVIAFHMLAWSTYGPQAMILVFAASAFSVLAIALKEYDL